MIHAPVFISDERIGGGANAKHNALFIRIWRKALWPVATLFQEVREWRFLAVRAFPAALTAFIAGYLVLQPDAVGTAMLAFGAIVLALLSWKFPFWTRRMEIVGKSSEVAVAVIHYGADEEEKLLFEAGTLTRYGQFKGISLDEIVSMMEEEMPAAYKAARRHSKWIEKWKAKLG